MKPPYRVPTMSEINAVPWNGLTVASFFAGCGGSSLGYRMAGFRVGYANDIDEVAAASYRANTRPWTTVDVRSVRDVSPDDVIKACGGVPDVIDGSPPCTVFSTAGRRDKAWGKEKEHGGVKQSKIEDLFFDWLRVIEQVRPRAFVGENVSGMVKGTSKGYFKLVLAEMRRIGYDVQAALLDAQWMGVPQVRKRVVFVGLRSDLELPAFTMPEPFGYRYSIADACPWLAGAAAISGGDTFNPEWGVDASGKPSRSITCSVSNAQASVHSAGHPPVELALDDVDNEIVPLKGMMITKWRETKKGSSHPINFSLQRPDERLPCPTIMASDGGVSTRASMALPDEPRKFTISELRRLSAFPDDFRLVGTHKQRWARVGNCVPPLMIKGVALRLAEVLK